MYNASRSFRQFFYAHASAALLWLALPCIISCTPTAYAMQEKRKDLLNINSYETETFLPDQSGGEPLGSNDSLSNILLKHNQGLSTPFLTNIRDQAIAVENVVLVEALNQVLKQREHDIA